MAAIFLASSLSTRETVMAEEEPEVAWTVMATVLAVAVKVAEYPSAAKTRFSALVISTSQSAESELTAFGVAK